jgi:4-alpha-glucanotransferase
MFFPIYSLHSQRSWGAGNFTDWAEFTRWAASFGANVMGTLPLLAAFLDGPFGDPSPYSPASRLFWNEFYLDITAIPEFTACAEAQKLAGSAAFQKRLETFRRGALIDYRSEMAVRRKVLEQLGRFFFSKSSARRREFERFLSARPGVEQYAEFRAVCEKTARPWQLWPQRLREGSLRKGDYSEETKRYHLYVQWLAQEQMDQLLQAANRAGAHFYLDLPLGVNPAGYDTWREREVFALNASAGAPPDVFFTKGQDWGFAPLHPQKLRAQGYRYVLDYLRFQMRHTDLLRIDHVMSLHRLYWIPNGFSAAEGAYVTYRADELYALFCLESHRHRTMLVGENLGTVPPEVNAAMERHRLRKMYVVQYEQRTDPKAALPLPPRQCVASMNTHDMPPFAAFWRGDDIADRADLGLIRGKKLREQKRTRKKMKEALVIFLRRHGLLQTKPPGPADVFRACLEWLSSSRAETVLINLEDLWGETLQQNVPGTLNERPNWRRKARLTLEEIRQLPQVAQLLRNASAIRSRRSTPRTDSERQHRKGVSRAFRISSPHRVGRDAAETFRASNP